MRLQVFRPWLIMAAVGGLLVQTASGFGTVRQVKNPLVWAKPVTIKRIQKPNRKRVRPLPKKPQIAPLLTLQWHVLMRGDGNVQQEVDSNRLFETGDQLKLSITTNQNGYLYIISQTAGGDGEVVFPDKRINKGQNYVTRNVEYLIPSYCPAYEKPDDCWWKMAPPAGREELIIIFSRDKITSLPNSVAEAGDVVKREVIEELKATSQQKVEQSTGELPIPGRRRTARFATRVQNTNPDDNEELIAAIALKHGE